MLSKIFTRAFFYRTTAWQLALAAPFLNAAAPGFTLALEKAEGQVEFEATAMPGGSKIHGRAKSGDGEEAFLEGELKFVPQEKTFLVSGAARFPLARLNTGVAMRDRAMKKDYLDTKTFAKAEMILDNVPASADGTKFTARLTLHGVTKPVTGTAQIEAKPDSVSLALDFSLDLGDFGIPTPHLMAVTVDPNIGVVAVAHGVPKR